VERHVERIVLRVNGGLHDAPVCCDSSR
jgi:hypothetical protein